MNDRENDDGKPKSSQRENDTEDINVYRSMMSITKESVPTEEIKRQRQRRHSILHTTENEPLSTVETTLVVLSIILFWLTFPVAIIFSLIVLSEFERAVVLRLGHLKKKNPFGPGIIFILPCVDEWSRIDLRIISYEVPSQQILTKDSVTVAVDAVVFYRIYDPLRSIIQVDNVHTATKRLAQTTLRNVAGTKRIIELLTEKDSIALSFKHILDEGTEPWGVKVERVEIKDVRLPRSLHRAMAAEAEASREAHAKVAAAEGELAASKALKEAADVMSQNPITLQLRYLMTLSFVASDRLRSIIFPFPIDLIRRFIEKMAGRGNAKEDGNPGKDEPPNENTKLNLRYLMTLSFVASDRIRNIIFPFPIDLIRRFIRKMAGRGNAREDGNPGKDESPNENTILNVMGENF